MFSMDKDKVPSPNGFPMDFFQSCWDIVGGDISFAIADFFKKNLMLRTWNSTFITLIPKVSGANEYKLMNIRILGILVYAIMHIRSLIRFFLID